MNCKGASHDDDSCAFERRGVLRDRYVSSADVMEARHFQTIWLLAKGHGVGEVAEMTSFGQRWIEQLVARYNAEGPDALGDLRRRNGSTARVLTPEVLAKLRVRLQEAPDDGGLWTSAKVAAFIARELGLEKVAVQRGWEALKACDMSISRRAPKIRSPPRRTRRRRLKTYGPPRLQAVLSRAPFDQSASTYPASGRAPGQDGDTRVPVLIKLSASSAIF